MNPEHKLYLDQLRESGVTNMYGAGAYLQQRFKLSEKEAQAVLFKWMEDFQKGDSK